MDENLHDIEDLFLDAIEKHEEMPPESVWSNIDNRLDKRSVLLTRRKNNQLKRLSAILLVLLLGTIAYEWQTKSATGIKSRVLPETPKAIVDKSYPSNHTPNLRTKKSNKPDSGNSVVFQNKNGYFNDTSAEYNVREINKEIANPLSKAAKTSREQKTLYLNGGIVTSPLSSAEAGQKNQESVNPKSSVFTDNTLIKKNVHLPDNVVKRKFFKNLNLSKNNKQYNSTPGDSTELRNDAASPFSAIEGKKNYGHFTSKPKLSNTDHKPISPAVIISSFTKTSPLVTINTKHNAPRITPVMLAGKQSGFHFTLMPFFAPQFNFNHIVDDDDHRSGGGQGRNDLDDIRKGENDKSSYSLGVLMDIHLKKRWFIQTGLNYTNKSADIDPKKVYAYQNNGDVKYRFDFSSGYTYLSPKNGVTPSVGDSAFTTASQSNFQYVGVPLIINYIFSRRSFNFIPSFGAAINLLIRQRVATNIATGTSTEKEQITDIRGIKKIYLNTITGVALQYNAGKKFSIDIIPAVNFALGTINKNAVVKSYPNSFNIAAGLKWYF